MNPNYTNQIGRGFQIPYVGRQGLMTRRRANMVIAVCNALLKGTIVRGKSDGIFLTSNNFVISLNDFANSDSGLMTWQGDYNVLQNTPYAPGDVVRVLPDNPLINGGFQMPGAVGEGLFAMNARAGIYVCYFANTPYITGADTIKSWPQYPEPDITGDSIYWQLVGGLEHWRGDYNPDPNTNQVGAAYSVGDIVQVSPDSPFVTAQTIPGTYVCIKNAPSPVQVPIHAAVPDRSFYFGFDYWQTLSTWPSAINTCASDGSSVEAFADQQVPPST